MLIFFPPSHISDSIFAMIFHSGAKYSRLEFFTLVQFFFFLTHNFTNIETTQIQSWNQMTYAAFLFLLQIILNKKTKKQLNRPVIKPALQHLFA